MVRASLWVCASLVVQLCPAVCDTMDCSPLGSSVHGILSARVLDWVTISFSRGSSQCRDQTWVSCIEGGLFTIESQPSYRFFIWLKFYAFSMRGSWNNIHITRNTFQVWYYWLKDKKKKNTIPLSKTCFIYLER